MNGRPPKSIKVNRAVRFIDLIPEDGTCIRFNELQDRCKQHGISYRILLKELERLEKAGTVVKEAVIAKRGAGTCYRRTVFPRMLDKTEPSFIFSDYISHAVEYVKSIQDEQELEKEASRLLNNLLADIALTIHDELIQHAQTDDKEQAEKHLNSVLADIVVPMIKETSRLSDLPVASNQKVITAIEDAYIYVSLNWNGLWEMSSKIDEKIAEGKEKK